MSIHNFTRTNNIGVYDINNPYCVDGEGNRVTLAKEIKAEDTLPGKFNICCKGSNCKITFDVELDSAQETTLASIVSAHQAHTEG